jgi:LmbE family N-acetylglucosaminyl deacetylase
MEADLTGRIVVVSPHLDDAVLSLGAAMARAASADWTVITVFAGDPDSTDAAGPYDRRCGFLTAADAAIVRRREDQRACYILGAKPVWLPFGDIQYDRFRDADSVWDLLEPHVYQAQVLLLPGFPLTHRDHAWITELVLGRAPESTRIGFYAEQPYARSAASSNPRHGFVAGRVVHWVSLRGSIAERLAKGRACRAYWSQFRALGCHLPRRCLLPEVFWTDERLGWPEAGALQSQFDDEIRA